MGQRMLPLVHSHITARLLIAIPVVFQTLFCPAFYGLGLLRYVPIGATGELLAGRVMLKMTAAAN